MTAPIDRFERDLAGWLETGGKRARTRLAPRRRRSPERASHAPAARLARQTSDVCRSARTVPERGRRRSALADRGCRGVSSLLALGAAWIIGSRLSPDPEAVPNGQILVARQLRTPRRPQYLTMDADGSGETPPLRGRGLRAVCVVVAGWGADHVSRGREWSPDHCHRPRRWSGEGGASTVARVDRQRAGRAAGRLTAR